MAFYRLTVQYKMIIIFLVCQNDLQGGAMNKQNFFKIVEKKDSVNFIITTKDKSILKDTLEEITRQIKIKKIEKANVIICTDSSQFMEN